MMNRLQVLIPPPLDKRLRKAASRSRLSRGEWVRRAIARSLEEAAAGSADPLAGLAGLKAPTADIRTMLGEIEAGRK
jgi:predicted transcriptional regulator